MSARVKLAPPTRRMVETCHAQERERLGKLAQESGDEEAQLPPERLSRAQRRRLGHAMRLEAQRRLRADLRKATP